MLSIYKKHDPQTQILQSNAKDLSIGWIGCVSDLAAISAAFEEIKTEGLHVSKNLAEVINWVIVDQKLDDASVNEPSHSRQDTMTSGGKRKS